MQSIAPVFLALRRLLKLASVDGEIMLEAPSQLRGACFTLPTHQLGAAGAGGGP